MDTKIVIVVLVTVTVVALVAAYLYLGGGSDELSAPVVNSGVTRTNLPAEPKVIETPVGEAIKDVGLGGEIFDQAIDVLEGVLPETGALVPETNPLEGVYKNPFE